MTLTKMKDGERVELTAKEVKAYNAKQKRAATEAKEFAKTEQARALIDEVTTERLMAAINTPEGRVWLENKQAEIDNKKL